MTRFPRLAWDRAINEAKADRAERPAVRAQQIRSAAPGGPYVAWRGQTGRRYICIARPLSGRAAYEAGENVVLLFVRPDGVSGFEVVEAVPSTAADLGERSAMVARAVLQGATALHVYRLAESEAARVGVAGDVFARAAGTA